MKLLKRYYTFLQTIWGLKNRVNRNPIREWRRFNILSIWFTARFKTARDVVGVFDRKVKSFKTQFMRVWLENVDAHKIKCQSKKIVLQVRFWITRKARKQRRILRLFNTWLFTHWTSTYNITRRYRNKFGYALRVVYGCYYEFEIFCGTQTSWRFSLTALGFIASRVDTLKKRRRHYVFKDLSSAAISSSITLVAWCESKLPPTPDDPLYCDHTIWAKGVHEVTEEDRLRIAEKQKAALDESQRQAALAQQEQEWNDDFSDMILFVMFGEILIYMISAYRRGGGW